MSSIINIIMSAVLDGTQTFNESISMPVDAVDLIENINVPAAAVDQEVDIEPGTDVVFIMIKSNRYPVLIGVGQLSFKLHTLSPTPVVVKMNNALMIPGLGNVGILPAVPDKIFFSNADVADCLVTILVGRKAST
jgi:hypothetical protein